MPVPQLAASINKYLTAIKPLLNEAEYETSKRCADEFGKAGGVGETLQKLLIERSKSTDNWVNFDVCLNSSDFDLNNYSFSCHNGG